MIKTILNIIPFIVSDEYLKKLNSDIPEAKHNSRLFFEQLPEYYLDNKGNVQLTEYNYHFYNRYNDFPKFYYMFDATPVEPILKEEISNCGMVEFFKDIELKTLFEHLCETDIFPDKHSGLLKKVFRKKTLNDLNFFGIYKSINVVMGIEYIGSGEDFDVNYHFLGYLNDELKFIDNEQLKG